MRELKIGRAKDNDIFIDDNSVSRYHAVLVLSDDEFVIVDNNATNGTFVNGSRIKGSQILKVNDILKVGNSIVPWRNYMSNDLTSDEVILDVVTDSIRASEIHKKQINKSIFSRAGIAGIILGVFLLIGMFVFYTNKSDSNKIMHRWECSDECYGISAMNFINKSDVNVITCQYPGGSKRLSKCRWHIVESKRNLVINTDSNVQTIYEYRFTNDQLILVELQSEQVVVLNKDIN
jgi:hypothetical protein